MKRTFLLLGLLLGLPVVGCHQLSAEDDATTSDHAAAMSQDDDDDDADDGEDVDDDESAVGLDQVPETVKAAALAAVPGLVLSSAETENEHGSLVYCLHGSVDGREYEVEVSASGEVLEIEQDDD
jgi:uncharacterized membrane protein YkoI